MWKNNGGWTIREVKLEDYQLVANVYNSNQSFLQNHLGVDIVDADFIADEVQSMKKIGFSPCIIVEDTRKIIGVLDYKYNESNDVCKNEYSDECYLSLMMLAKKYQEKGLGSEIYKTVETHLREEGCKSIRIDVVKDYKENVMSFWRQLGFQACEEVKLTWGNKSSLAVVMRKVLEV